MVTLTQVIDLFFAPPTRTLGAADPISVLYALRRDAAQNLGFNPNTFNAIANPQPQAPYSDFRALWPAVLTMMAGFDLLAKLYAGSDDDSAHGAADDRFRAFAREYAEEYVGDPELANVLLQLRKALGGSFALYSKNDAGMEYRFTLGEGMGVFATS